MAFIKQYKYEVKRSCRQLTLHGTHQTGSAVELQNHNLKLSGSNLICATAILTKHPHYE
jgi:hypothetical protein